MDVGSSGMQVEPMISYEAWPLARSTSDGSADNNNNNKAIIIIVIVIVIIKINKH